jgi:hypothetical protein
MAAPRWVIDRRSCILPGGCYFDSGMGGGLYSGALSRWPRRADMNICSVTEGPTAASAWDEVIPFLISAAIYSSRVTGLSPSIPLSDSNKAAARASSAAFERDRQQ